MISADWRDFLSLAPLIVYIFGGKDFYQEADSLFEAFIVNQHTAAESVRGGTLRGTLNG